MTTEIHPSPTGPTVFRSSANGVDSVRGLLEKHVQEHPLKAAAQAAAVGYALRLMPIRSLFFVGARLAGPILCLVGLWKACDRIEAPRREKR